MAVIPYPKELGRAELLDETNQGVCKLWLLLDGRLNYGLQVGATDIAVDSWGGGRGEDSCESWIVSGPIREQGQF